MNLNSNVKRVDSLMIASRCKRMSRLEIIYATTANSVKLIHRLGNEELISKELLHYLEPDDYNNVIYYCKGKDVSTRLEKHFWKLYRSKASWRTTYGTNFRSTSCLFVYLLNKAKAMNRVILLQRTRKKSHPQAFRILRIRM